MVWFDFVTDQSLYESWVISHTLVPFMLVIYGIRPVVVVVFLYVFETVEACLREIPVSDTGWFESEHCSNSVVVDPVNGLMGVTMAMFIRLVFPASTWLKLMIRIVLICAVPLLYSRHVHSLWYLVGAIFSLMLMFDYYMLSTLQRSVPSSTFPWLVRTKVKYPQLLFNVALAIAYMNILGIACIQAEKYNSFTVSLITTIAFMFGTLILRSVLGDKVYQVVEEKRPLWWG